MAVNEIKQDCGEIQEYFQLVQVNLKILLNKNIKQQQNNDTGIFSINPSIKKSFLGKILFFFSNVSNRVQVLPSQSQKIINFFFVNLV